MANNTGDWRYKLLTLMVGRYGFDQLSRDMFIVSVIVVIINILVSSQILTALSLLLVIAAMARILSRNITARRRELETYQKFMVGPRTWWRNINESYLERKAKMQGKRAVSQAQAATKAAAKERKKQQKQARRKQSSSSDSSSQPSAYTASADTADNIIVVFSCEECGQSLSVPRGKGTLRVTCPKCGHIQKKKS